MPDLQPENQGPGRGYEGCLLRRFKLIPNSDQHGWSGGVAATIRWLESWVRLDHDDPHDQFLEKPAWRFNDSSAIEPDLNQQNVGAEPGARIGAWEVMREISSGGMGTVYLAERAVNAGGSRKQRAAIKVIRNRVDPERFATRFRRERQIAKTVASRGE